MKKIISLLTILTVLLTFSMKVLADPGSTIGTAIDHHSTIGTQVDPGSTIRTTIDAGITDGI